MKITLGVIGSPGVGKATLCRTYTRVKSHEKSADVPVERFMTCVTLNNQDVILECWVASDIKHWTPLCATTDCFFLCFSVDDSKSLEHLVEWNSTIRQLKPSALCFLVGCKTDLLETLNKIAASNQSENGKEQIEQQQSNISETENQTQENNNNQSENQTTTTPPPAEENGIKRSATPPPNVVANNSLVSLEKAKEVANTISALNYFSTSSKSTLAIKELFDDAIAAVITHRFAAAETQQANPNPHPEGNSNNSTTTTSTNSQTGTTTQTTAAPHSQVNKPFKQKESLTALLKRADVQLPDIFDDDIRAEFQKEFRAKNPKLMQVLARRENLSKMLDMLATENPPNMLTYEVLTAEHAVIQDSFVAQPPLWSKLFSFIRNPMPSNLTATLYVRTIAFYITNRSYEFLSFIKERSDVVNDIVDRLEVDSYVQLLLVMLECENTLQSMGVDGQWSNFLISYIGTKVRSEQLTEHYVENLRDLLEQIIQSAKKYPKSQLLVQMQRKPFLEPVLERALDPNNDNAIEYMNILSKLMSLCINDNPNEYESQKVPLLVQYLLREDTNNNNNSQSNVNIFKSLFQLLYMPPKKLPPSVETTAGEIAPLGFYRLKCVELVLAMLRMNYYGIDSALIIEYKVVNRVTDLFFQYKWNNVLHTLVEKIAILVLENKPAFLCLFILQKGQLLNRIVQAQQNEEQEKSMKLLPKEKFRPHQGYMGHLFGIAGSIVKASKKHPAIYYLLEDQPNRSWKKIEKELQKYEKMVADSRLLPSSKKSFLNGVFGRDEDQHNLYL